MAIFMLHGLDGEDSVAIRKATRQAHLDWLATLGASYKLGSALLGPDGATACGSVIVIEAATLDAAKAVFFNDPYVKAGLWDRIEIQQMAQFAPK